ncbi:cytoskeleton protein RodZ [Povalibacter uvarum]|uniref:Cytoskeleton protein RodZ n=1 Tax=Povalibacter uvarum TaxID=732238 RepID=A0A841HV61_9GAMM|nr:RodZ domain-containing protein [Povalibacter uvarum]MBB6096544.1 cytoskeleton protein RodZ [Povalibacter uvarum]
MAQTAEPAAAAPPPPSSPTPGEFLRAGREGRGLTVQQVADELHLDVRLVQAIESNNFLLLGAPVYARGHLRKYATVLGLSPEVVISHYETLTDVPVTPTVIPASVAVPPPQRVSLRVPMLIVGGIVAVGLLIWVAIALLGRTQSSPVSSVPQSATAPAAAPAEIPQQTNPGQSAAAPPAQPLVAEGAPAASRAPALVEQPAPRAAVAGEGVRMRLTFSESSWVEIYDAGDRRLMYGIGQPGQTRVVAGTAPLRVTLGLASAVTLDVNDSPVVVPRRANRDAARFTVAADGSLR